MFHSDCPSAVQVVGHKEGLDVMERADPLFLLIGLPTIPVMLILGKMIRWEDYVLRLWRKYSNKLQILNSIFPGQPQHSQICTVGPYSNIGLMWIRAPVSTASTAGQSGKLPGRPLCLLDQLYSQGQT